MKQSIVTLLIAFFLLGCEQKFEYANKDANLTLEDKNEKDLSSRHLEYWEDRSKNEFNSSYTYEMPYQQFIKSLHWYNDFHKTGRKHFKIIQKEINIKEKSALIESQFIYKKSKYTFHDPWFLVKGKWYHQFKTTKLPQ